ncbi:serine hydrolase domain-containing protein [Pseudoalteromonas aurantia]|uniref:Beta-lactamase-related domain-containing protein n=1 Tax=Pseudoalteromonas aurantia 208 TaxID=1314867 RepID=A0ABR9E7G5_9GAMM|nr:serine hydrolase [Pseudoalteromonas aurantia]MBE0366941.1 hypothetical protein [Pseudoalteromonas aurantia 208]
MASKLTIKILVMTTLLSVASNGIFISTANAESRIAPEVTNAEKSLSFWDLPYLKQAYISAAPKDRKEGISVGQLGDRVAKKNIIKLAEEIAQGKYGLYDGLLISHKGKLVFESYYRRGRVNLAAGQASAAKTYTSLALGRAIQLGYLSMADLDKPLVSFLKDVDTTKLVAGAEKITLHKALTMRGGIRVSDEQVKALEETPAKLKGQGQVQALLEHSTPINSESQRYSYGNFNPTLVMQVLDAVVPGTAQSFIKKELLDKLGITNYRWQNAISGLPEAGWRVSLTSRDMLKWGALLANKGKWQGEQLISMAYLNKGTRGIVQPAEAWIPKAYQYGYYIYQMDIPVKGKSYNANFAWGGGGQYIITIAELDLIVVIKGHDQEDKIMPHALKTIVPVFAH